MSSKTQSFLSPEAKKIVTEQLHLQNVTDWDIERFLMVCERTKLDPITRQIYGRGQRVNKGSYESPKWETELVIITGIEGLRAVAERTNEYLGQTEPKWCGKDGKWTDVWMAEEAAPYAARCGVIRKGFPEPLVAVARYASYVQLIKKGKGDNAKWVPNPFWGKMADVLLLKCAEAAALRRAFPQVLDGIYLSEEIIDTDTETPQPEQEQTNQAANQAGFKPAATKEESKPTEKKNPPGEEPPPAATAKKEPKPTPPAPVEEKQQETAPEPSGEESVRLTCIKLAAAKNKLVTEVPTPVLESIKRKWVDQYADKIAKDPAMKREADAVVAELATRADRTAEPAAA